MLAVGTKDTTQDLGVIEVTWDRIHARLDQPMARLEELISLLFDRVLSDEERALAIRVGDEAAVQLGELNFAGAADKVRAAGGLLNGSKLGPSEAIRIAGLLDEAREFVSSAVADIRCGTRSGVGLMVVGPISHTTDQLIWLAFGQGLSVLHVEDPQHAQSNGVDAVLAIFAQDDPSMTRSMARSLRQRFPSIPVIGVLESSGVQHRVAAVEAATTVLDRAVTAPADIIGEVRHAILRHRQPRSLAVFGSGSTWLAERMNRRGLSARSETNLTELLAKVAGGEVRSVVLTPHPANAGTSSLDRFGVLRLIRADPALRATTVVIVDDQPDSVRRHDALRKGADMYVGPDIDLDELAVMVKSTMSRRCEIEPLAARSTGVGVEPWDSAAIRIDEMLSSSLRSKTTVALAVVRTESRDDHVMEKLDHELAAQFRSDVVISRLDRSHLLVVMRDATSTTLANRMTGLYGRLGLEQLGGSIACVECPSEGTTLDAALSEGEKILATIATGRGAKVRCAVDPEREIGRADVLVLDPDPTVGHVLVSSLERRGIEVQYLSDGLLVLDLLTGANPQPLPRVILMDLDLRDIDGMQFLRQLGKAGILDDVKVIALSPNMNESELRVAFELGIDDFVPKPFSVPLLLRRLTKALER